MEAKNFGYRLFTWKIKAKIEQIIVAVSSMYIRCIMQAMMIKEDVGHCKGPSGICLRSDMMLFLL